MVGYPYSFRQFNTYFRARHQHSDQHIFICPNSFHGFEEFLCEKFRCIQCNLRNCQQTISDVRGELAFDAVFNILASDLQSMPVLIIQRISKLRHVTLPVFIRTHVRFTAHCSRHFKLQAKARQFD